MSAPQVSGHRLGIVLGSGPFRQLIDGGERLTVETGRGPVALVETPDAVLLARHGDTDLGEGHVPAHRVDHHRNIAALCAAGCDRVLALGSVGSLRGWPVGSMVAPFDIYAPQVNPSFHDDVLGHTVPGFDAAWRDLLLATWESAASSNVLDGGVYAQTTGPRFETAAEVRALAVHADIVGMTLAAELILAGEAGLAYAAVCVVDNLANGLGEHPLTWSEFETGRDATQHDLEKVLAALVPVLAPSESQSS